MQIFSKINSFKTRIAAGFLGFILIASVIAPMPAKAGVDSAILTIKDFAWEIVKGVLVVAQKKMLDGFTNQTIKWIKGGAKGQPGFVQDFGGFLEDAVDQAVGQVLTDEIGRDLCSPFQVELKIMLLPEREFGEKVKCSLSDIVENIEDFTRDFRNGGWQAWLKIQEPQNNIYGAYFLTVDAMKKKAEQAKESAKTEVVSSGGFLGSKKCGVYDSAGTSMSGELKESDADIFVAALEDDERTMGGQRTFKKVCQIVTPGDTVGERLNSSLKWDSEWLVNSQSVAASIGAIIDAAINKVTDEGLASAGKLVSGNKTNSNQVKKDVNKDAAEQLGDAIENYKKYNELIRIKYKIIQIGAKMGSDLQICNPDNPDFAVMSAERAADEATLDSLTKGLQDLLLKSSELQALRKEILKMPNAPSQDTFDAMTAGDSVAIALVNNYRTKRDKFIEKEMGQYAVLTAEEKEGLTQDEQDALIIKKRQELENEDAKEKLAKDKLNVLQEQAYTRIGPLARLNIRFNNLVGKDNKPPSQEGERLANVNASTGATMVSLLNCLRGNVEQVNDLLGKLDPNTGRYTTPDLLNTYDQYVLAGKLQNVVYLLRKQDAELINLLTESSMSLSTIISNLDDVTKRMMNLLPQITVTEEVETTDPTTGKVTKTTVQVQKDNPLNLTFPINFSKDAVPGNTYGNPPIDPIDTALSEIRKILTNTSPNMSDQESYKVKRKWFGNKTRMRSKWPKALEYLDNKFTDEVQEEIAVETKINYSITTGRGNTDPRTNPTLDAAIKDANAIYGAHNIPPDEAQEMINNAIEVGRIRWSMQETEQM
ncbi:MAG: hypothetical protein UX53_C0003G0054 [Candidatus Azambacteria bacterium GW2011_GWB2_46_37]|uniref:Uncharacterized protein n=1 Tax=Candidatus Azambacteria bacterium GW2011_GWB2_46_37 TaxID=1618618 RepID=A0A0G1SC24_9BACT|nr:MAG: hypothetical protein UX53_C0003G0054 [Candidatus Azambacteria bacterium GW2011_GWB2_46_37]